WAELRRISQTFLQPWEPTWPADDLSRAAFRHRLSAYARDIDLGQGYPFFVFRQSDDALVGGVTLSNIRRGVAQMGVLGYWIGQPF
ncbi:GNAT family protein, partial [Escherichia coli]|uniref:GNAT family protein n=3 Tax=Pseudomonadota TaxID=1224 RepID=UPI0028DF3272